MLGDDFEHRPGVAVLQPRPAHVLIGDAAALSDFVLTQGKDATFDRLVEAISLVFFAGMRLVEAAHEQQVGDLLDHLERIGYAAGSKGIPHVIDFVAKFPS